MPLATLPYWVNHIIFILSHPPDWPAKETSALLSPPTHWLCSLNGRCFPAQRNREHIAGNEDEGRSQLPASGLEWSRFPKQDTRAWGYRRQLQAPVRKIKCRVNRVKWLSCNNREMDLVEITENLWEHMCFCQWMERDGTRLTSLAWTLLALTKHRPGGTHILFLGNPEKVPPTCYDQGPFLQNGRGSSSPANLIRQPQSPNEKVCTESTGYPFYKLGNGTSREVSKASKGDSKSQRINSALILEDLLLIIKFSVYISHIYVYILYMQHVYKHVHVYREYICSVYIMLCMLHNYNI